MIKRYLFIYCTAFIMMAGINTGMLMAQQEQDLPHEMTREELTRVHEIGMRFVETPPPAGLIRNVAEFEPMEGVLIRYPFGIPFSLIVELAENDILWTIASGNASINTVISNYTSNGVNLANCRFINAPSNSKWTRDYGPWFIQIGDTGTAIIDFPYNRPRPLDDSIPKTVADSMNIPWYGMKVIHTGGNYMTTGNNISSSTQIVVTENPTLTQAQINQKFQAYLGIDTYHIVQDPNGTYINHIDCWGKFLAPDKVLIRSVPPTHAQYNDIESTAAYFAAATSSYGLPFNVYRVFTPNDQPYTNSLILNNKVYVPVMGQIQYDTAALHVYEQAMPGYEVLGFAYPGTGGWESTDALHCRAIGLADRGMLYIDHIPVAYNQPALTPVTINARIVPYSKLGVYPDSVQVFYKTGGNIYTPITMTATGGLNYTASIPGQPNGTDVRYYIHAADSSGRKANHALMGPFDPHEYTVGSSAIGELPGYKDKYGFLTGVSPNPFRELTLIDFKIKQMATVNLTAFDLAGRKTAVLISQPLGPGNYSIAWDGRNDDGNRLAEGMYFIRLDINGVPFTKKVIITR